MATVRPAQAEDIVSLAEYWYDQTVLRQQRSSALRIRPDAVDHWAAAAHRWLGDPDCLFLVYLVQEERVGAVVARVQENDPGLLPERIAVLLALVVDLHTVHARGGVGRRLITALRERLAGRGIDCLQVQAPHNDPVEQAFWRGIGARRAGEVFWVVAP